MFDRGTLKSNGKAAFTRNYWKCVLAGFLLTLAEGSRGGSSGGSSAASRGGNGYGSGMGSSASSELSNIMSIIAAFLVIVLIVALVVLAISIALKVFVFNPLAIGTNKYFVQNAINPDTSLSVMGDGFKFGYGNGAKIMFLRDLYTFLWSLLLIIPGIIKSYEYMMVPYLLADDPEMTAEEAFAKSKSIMDGNKLDVFILDLSFIGWKLLGILTCGLLDLFFVNPYYYATRAELYLTLNPSYTENTDNYTY